MKKYLIYGLIIVVIVGGLLTVFYFFPDLFSFGESSEKAAPDNTNLNTNESSPETNINTTPVNLNISALSGETEVNKSVTYEEITLNVLTADRKDNFENLTAGENKTFLILYLAKINDKTAAEILPVVKNYMKIKAGDTEYSPKIMNIAGANSADYATSYFIFEVNEDESGFSLNFGAEDSLETIEIGL